MKQSHASGILAAPILLASCGVGQAATDKVLIVGIDGCRPDAVLVAETPHMDRLWKNGAFSFHARTDQITVSGPCWTSMLTGVWHKKHGVLNNDYENMPLTRYPHFFRRVKEHDPKLRTASIVQWGPTNKILLPGDVDVMASAENDSDVTKLVVKLLADGDPDAVFVQFDDVDHAGHAHGYGPHIADYVAAVEAEDRLIGDMLHALESRKTFAEENWLVMITADHGGMGKGHGGDSPQELTVFVIAHGPSVVQGELHKKAAVVDVAVTAMAHLGVAVQGEWRLDGEARGLQVAPQESPADKE